MFSEDKLVNDYFNIDGNFVMRLREYKEYIKKGNLIIRTVERTNFGVGNVYQEILPAKRKVNLKLTNINRIAVEKIF